MKLTALQIEYLSAINDFVTPEYGDGLPENLDLEFIGVLYSTFGDEEHEVQVYVDIAEDDDVIEKVWVNGTEVYREHYTHDEFLRDVKTWSFDALYEWALAAIETRWNRSKYDLEHCDDRALLLYYLEAVLGIYKVENGKHIIELPYEPDIECDTLEELMGIVRYDVTAWADMWDKKDR